MTTLPKLDLLHDSRILLVDDMEDERLLLATYLQSQGCRVYLATDGLDAQHKAELVMPDIVLMDVRMPVCDGLTACQALRTAARTSHIPIIFLTGATMPEERVQGLLAGAVDYMNKPFDFEEVRLRLAIHLSNQKPADPDAPVQSQRSSKGSNLSNILFTSARNHLLDSLANAPDLQQLARKVGTNSKRLNEAFKSCVGITVFEYLREERMKEARTLLAETEWEIQTIALEVGYTSGANFATAFKERFGTSPSHFRLASRGVDPE